MLRSERYIARSFRNGHLRSFDQFQIKIPCRRVYVPRIYLENISRFSRYPQLVGISSKVNLRTFVLAFIWLVRGYYGTHRKEQGE